MFSAPSQFMSSPLTNYVVAKKPCCYARTGEYLTQVGGRRMRPWKNKRTKTLTTKKRKGETIQAIKLHNQRWIFAPTWLLSYDTRDPWLCKNVAARVCVQACVCTVSSCNRPEHLLDAVRPGQRGKKKSLSRNENEPRVDIQRAHWRRVFASWLDLRPFALTDQNNLFSPLLLRAVNEISAKTSPSAPEGPWVSVCVRVPNTNHFLSCS